MFKIFDRAFDIDAPLALRGTSEDPLRDRISEASLVLEVLSQNKSENPTLIKKLGIAFRDLKEPIFCLKNGVKIENPALMILQELVDRKDNPNQLVRYVLQENPLSFTLLQEPLCKLPADSLRNHYPTLQSLALMKVQQDHPLPFVLPLSRFISPLMSETPRRLAQLMLQILGEIGSEDSRNQGFDYLIPLLKELTHRDAWVKILLVASSANDTDQRRFQEFLKFLVLPRIDLNHKSIADVVLNAIGRGQSPHLLFQFVSSLGKYVDLEDNFAEKAFTTLYYVLKINNVHPFIDLAKELGSKTSSYSNLIKILFQISGKMKSLDGKTRKNYLANALSSAAGLSRDPEVFKQFLDARHESDSKFYNRSAGF